MEDKARRKKKRMAAIKALEEEKRKRKTKELDDILLIDSTHGSTQNFVNLAFDANAP